MNCTYYWKTKKGNCTERQSNTIGSALGGYNCNMRVPRQKIWVSQICKSDNFKFTNETRRKYSLRYSRFGVSLGVVVLPNSNINSEMKSRA